MSRQLNYIEQFLSDMQRNTFLSTQRITKSLQGFDNTSYLSYRPTEEK